MKSRGGDERSALVTELSLTIQISIKSQRSHLYVQGLTDIGCWNPSKIRVYFAKLAQQIQ